MRLLALMIGLTACSQTTSVGSDNTTGNTQAAISDGLTVAEVQAAIDQAGENWTAGNNSMTALSPNDRKAKLGAPLPVIADVALRTQETPDTSLPAQFDWRNNNGQNFVSPILDQEQCGSCVVFAAIGVFESVLNIAANDPTSPWELSTQQFLSCSGGSCGGWYGDAAAEALVSNGATDSACMQYKSGMTGDDGVCSNECADHDARTIKARSYSKPTNGSVSANKLKQAIMKGPIMTSMTVYDDLMTYTSGVYKHVTGGIAGGHEVSIVGWDDAAQAWICRNNWGTGWGEQGFFRVAYTDKSGIGADTDALVANTPGPYVAFTGLRDFDLLSGVQTFPIDAQQVAAAATVGFSFIPQNNGQAITGSGGTIDTTTIPDGVYTLQPMAGSLKGQPRIVSVLNGTLTGAVAFQGWRDGQVLTGTETLTYTVTSSPVPLQAVALTITDSSGKTKTTTINTLAETNSIQWDTTHRPNGAATVTLVGSAGTQQLAPVTVHVTIQN